MYNPLVIVSSIIYHYLIYSNNVLLKYFVKPFTTILIIGASTEAVSEKTNKNKYKLYGKECIFKLENSQLIQTVT